MHDDSLSACADPTGDIITHATFAPFTAHGVVVIIYFAPSFPLTVFARRVERQLVWR